MQESSRCLGSDIPWGDCGVKSSVLCHAGVLAPVSPVRGSVSSTDRSAWCVLGTRQVLAG